MKIDQSKTLVATLNRIKDELEVIGRPEAKAEFVKNLDSLISTLSNLRAGIISSTLEAKTVEVQRPLEQVIEFLEFAKSDESLRALLLPRKKVSIPKSKKPPVEIPNNLTNEQIRMLLEKDLSKSELKTIALQRGISVGKSNTAEIRRDILKNLERQEGYGRLALS